MLNVRSFLKFLSDTESSFAEFHRNILVKICYFYISGEKATGSVDELLFGITDSGASREGKSDLDILGDILSTASLNENAYLADNQSGFSKEWRDMFGDQKPVQSGEVQPIGQLTTKTEGGMYMPSFLMEQLKQVDPQAASQPGSKSVEAERKSGPVSKNKESKSKKGQDMSAWFNLFSDLDPLANPDAIGSNKDADQERSC